ncbi:MAG: hypothetical protein VXZ51_03890 [Actinomycetota bacterium]|nr:hypothetical protein [Actinomycetota bacterium]
MGNKTRLNEATVRRFMKLAKLPMVNEQFFNEEEEPMEEPAMEEPAAEEPAAEEAPAEGDAGPAEVEMAERVASAVMDALEDELGVSTDVDVPEEGGEEPAAEEPAAEEPAGEEEMPLEERIVNEVTRRVAAKLLQRQKRRNNK